MSDTGGRTHPLLRATAAYFALGLASIEQMVAAAHAALDDEVYSYSLGEMVTPRSWLQAECEALFATALRELGIGVPTHADAVLAVLDHNAILLAEGAIDPDAGLRELASVELSLVEWYDQPTTAPLEVLAPLRPFITLYYRIDEVLGYGAYLEEQRLPRDDGQRVADIHAECIRLAKQWCRDRWGALVNPAWRTSPVVGLARAIDNERAFDRLAILADALEEAGCDQPVILSHCRQPGPHVSGCWVVELILGKQ